MRRDVPPWKCKSQRFRGQSSHINSESVLPYDLQSAILPAEWVCSPVKDLWWRVVPCSSFFGGGVMCDMNELKCQKCRIECPKFSGSMQNTWKTWRYFKTQIFEVFFLIFEIFWKIVCFLAYVSFCLPLGWRPLGLSVVFRPWQPPPYAEALGCQQILQPVSVYKWWHGPRIGVRSPTPCRFNSVSLHRSSSVLQRRRRRGTKWCLHWC